MNAEADAALSDKALTIAHLSDLHLPYSPQLTTRERFSKRWLSVQAWRRHRRFVQLPEILGALRADLHALRPQHVVITGDVTNFSLPAEFRQAAAWLDELGRHAGVSVVPGNHDALAAVNRGQGTELWAQWSAAPDQWPFVHRRGPVSFIGLSSAVVTAPLLARGRLGAAQLERLEQRLHDEGRAGRVRVVLLHHPVADAAVSWRKALADRRALRAVLAQAGAELVLHGHARWPRLEPLPGPHGPIPSLCVPSSTALPNVRDAAARWHLLRVGGGADGRWAQVRVREWDSTTRSFVAAAAYELRLPNME